MKRIVMMMLALAVTFGLGNLVNAEDAPKKEKKEKGPAAQFAKMDTNSDGKLSMDEFIAGKTGDALEKAKKRFTKTDADSDGSVTKEEMIAAAKAHAKKDGAAGDKKKKEKS